MRTNSSRTGRIGIRSNDQEIRRLFTESGVSL